MCLCRLPTTIMKHPRLLLTTSLHSTLREGGIDCPCPHEHDRETVIASYGMPPISGSPTSLTWNFGYWLRACLDAPRKETTLFSRTPRLETIWLFFWKEYDSNPHFALVAWASHSSLCIFGRAIIGSGSSPSCSCQEEGGGSSQLED